MPEDLERAAPDGAGDGSWSDQRRQAAQEHERRLRARQEAESTRASEMLARFVADARAAGLTPERLQVRGYGGQGRARSDVDGWYLRTDRSAGVGTDGAFYVLTAPLSLVDRVRGVRLTPSPPPLVLGAGGKDGESIDLADAIARLLP